jgi:hypothetical protein
MSYPRRANDLAPPVSKPAQCATPPAYPRPLSPQPPTQLVCPNGHPAQTNTAFCSTCGAAETYIPSGPMQSPFGPPPATRSFRWLIIAGLVAILVLTGGGIGALLAFGGSSDKTVTGQFVLTDSATADANCVGQGGYSDIGPGTTVILTNETGKILGSSALASGVADADTGTCTYAFTIPDVPTDQAQYAIQVSHRGQVANSKADMVGDGWTFALNLGSF